MLADPLDKKNWGEVGGIFVNVSLCCSPINKPTKKALYSAEVPDCFHGAKTALNMNDPWLADKPSIQSFLWVRSTLYPSTPLWYHYCVSLALMLVERGALMGEGWVGLSTPGPLFLSDPHSGSFSMWHLEGHSAILMAQRINKCASSLLWPEPRSQETLRQNR